MQTRLSKIAVVCIFVLLLFAGIQTVSFYLYKETISTYSVWVVLCAWLVTYAVLLTTLLIILKTLHRAEVAEKSMRMSEERLMLLIKHTPAAVAMFDRDMRYIAVSNRWLHDYQLSLDNVLGKSHYEVFPEIPLKKPEFMEHHQMVLNGATLTSEEDTFTRHDGRVEWLRWELHPWRYDNGEIGGLVMFTEVITESRKAIERLRESEARFERAVRGSSYIIWDMDIEKDEIYYSPNFERLMGYNPGELRQSLADWESLLHPDDHQRVANMLNDHLLRHAPYATEYRMRTKSGSYIWFEVKGEAEWDESGKPVHMSGALIDISERKKLENLKHEFVYTATHELRTPLTALKGAIDMLPYLLGKEVPERVQSMLDLAIQGSERMVHLIDDLLDVGKMEAGQMEFNMVSANIVDLVKQSLEMNKTYAQKYKVSYKLDKGVSEIMVKLDPDRFLQVMGNLLSNAAKFSPEGEKVHVKIDAWDDRVRVSVADKGEGIPEEFRTRIFQKFAQGHRNKGGTGLGLNITKTLVERMRGTIWYQSTISKGTTFHVEFPASITK